MIYDYEASLNCTHYFLVIVAISIYYFDVFSTVHHIIELFYLPT